MLSGEEIQNGLRQFVNRWRDYAGTERAEAQTFLNDLLACYGVDRRRVGAEFEYHRPGAGFMDLHWHEWCIVGMKAPSRAARLSEHYQQVFEYWLSSADEAGDKSAARYVVLCAFHRFEIWEPGRFPRSPRAVFSLDELPDRYDTLGFLAGPGVEPSFVEHHSALTKDAASTIAALFESLVERSAAPVDEIQRFIMQTVWTLFAEDLAMLDGYPLQTIVSSLRGDTSRSSAAELGHLFRVLNQKGNHNRRGIWLAPDTSTDNCSRSPPRCTSAPRSWIFSQLHASMTGGKLIQRSSDFLWKECLVVAAAGSSVLITPTKSIF